MRTWGQNKSGGKSLWWPVIARNKRSLTLNLKAKDGLDVFKKLVAQSDVVVENYRPDVKHRLGIDFESLRKVNPRLVYGSSSGYGKSGPYRDYPAMDLVMQAMSGVIDSTGHPDQPPVKAGPAICDFSAGIHLYAAIMTALYERERSRRRSSTGRRATVQRHTNTGMSTAAMA